MASPVFEEMIRTWSNLGYEPAYMARLLGMSEEEVLAIIEEGRV